jgi:formamidopyrimidine-DNA glycosylase
VAFGVARGEARTLDPEEVRRLHRAVRRVLRRGIELQGSTLRDYTTPGGEGGGMQDEFQVYGRAGEPCARCGRPIERLVVVGRGTWTCPRCQT